MAADVLAQPAFFQDAQQTTAGGLLPLAVTSAAIDPPTRRPSIPRDLPLDFLRGIALFLMVTDHLVFTSPYSYFTRERIGIVTGAEIFVLISGILVGQVYRVKIARDGFPKAMAAMMRRMLTLYCVYISITMAVFLISLIPHFDTRLLVPWAMYSLREAIGHQGLVHTIVYVLMLRTGPLRMNVIGMYVVLFAGAPLAMWLLEKGRTRTLLALSGALWVFNLYAEWRTIYTQFDNVFRVISWQFLFVIGVCAGYHRPKVAAFFNSVRGRWIIGSATIVSVLCCLFALHDPAPEVFHDLGPRAGLHVLSRQTVEMLYDALFSRKVIAPGRMVNLLCLFLTLYVLLKKCWPVAEKTLGWYFVVLGQASLYVYILHAVLLQFIYQLDLERHGNWWINFLCATAVLGLLWVMVKRRTLFWLIPR